MEFLSANFRCVWKKVGTFTVVERHGRVLEKLGGNVAAYFMTPDGRVLGASLGTVPAGFFLDEAKWAVEAAKSPALLAAAHRARSEDLIRDPFRGTIAFT